MQFKIQKVNIDGFQYRHYNIVNHNSSIIYKYTVVKRFIFGDLNIL